MKKLRELVRSAMSGLLTRMPGMMSCAEADRFIDEYLDGELPEAQARAMDRHLRLCRPCHSYLEAYRRTIALSKSYGDEPRPRMPKELVEAILSARSETS